MITVPLGVAFAIGINRWRTRTSTTFNFVMILSFRPRAHLRGHAHFSVFSQLYTADQASGPEAEVLGLVVWNISWPAIIVIARLVSIGPTFEEAAADLGASRFEAVRRVLVPLLMPAIFASSVLVFAGVIDDFVIVDLLSSSSATQPVSVLIYSATRGGNNGPALNADRDDHAARVAHSGDARLLRLPLHDPGRTGLRSEGALANIAGM